MQDSDNRPVPVTPGDGLVEGRLWPSADYQCQLERLRRHVGETVYLVMLNRSDIHLSVTLENKPARLLAIIDFQAPDPARGLYPHMLILDDGRGVNLGQVLRVSRERAFAPDEAQILFQQKTRMQQLLYRERQLSEASIAETSRQLLAALLGQRPAPQLSDDDNEVQ